MHLICVCLCLHYLYHLQHSQDISVGCGSMGISLCNYSALIEERQTGEPEQKVTCRIKSIRFGVVLFLHPVHSAT